MRKESDCRINAGSLGMLESKSQRHSRCRVQQEHGLLSWFKLFLVAALRVVSRWISKVVGSRGGGIVSGCRGGCKERDGSPPRPPRPLSRTIAPPPLHALCTEKASKLHYTLCINYVQVWGPRLARTCGITFLHWKVKRWFKKRLLKL